MTIKQKIKLFRHKFYFEISDESDVVDKFLFAITGAIAGMIGMIPIGIMIDHQVLETSWSLLAILCFNYILAAIVYIARPRFKMVYNRQSRIFDYKSAAINLSCFMAFGGFGLFLFCSLALILYMIVNIIFIILTFPIRLLDLTVSSVVERPMTKYGVFLNHKNNRPSYERIDLTRKCDACNVKVYDNLFSHMYEVTCPVCQKGTVYS